jgi:hypothetical protein
MDVELEMIETRLNVRPDLPGPSVQVLDARDRAEIETLT